MSVAHQTQTVMLGEVAAKVTVGHVGTTSRHYAAGGIPFLRTQNVGNGKIDRTDLMGITPEFHAKLKKSILRTGDVVISRVISNEIRCAVIPDDLDGANCANIIKIEPGDSIDSRFLMHFVTSPFAQRQLLRSRVGSAQSVVNTTVIKKWQIPLPPLSEQKRIAGILDAADALRAKRRQSLAQLDTLLQATFLDMFGDPVVNPKGWVVHSVGDVVSRLTNGYVGPTRDIYQETGVPYLLARHVHDNHLQFDHKTYVSEAFNQKHRKSILKGGDVLLVQSGHIGESAVVPLLHEGHNCHAMIVISPVKHHLLGTFLSSLFQQFHRIGYWERIKTGISVPHLNCRDVKKVLIPVPPLDLQRRFASFVESVEQQKSRLHTHLDELDALFASLQSRAFNGEL